MMKKHIFGWIAICECVRVFSVYELDGERTGTSKQNEAKGA